MSAGNLEEVKKKYGYKNISVATWRDPKGSILPARGGLKSPTISAEAAGRAYVPTYKVSYGRPPEPTDDEESDGEPEKVEEGGKTEEQEAVPESEGT